MKIRWKIFIGLISFSLLPLLLVYFTSQNGTRQLGRTLAEDTRRNLTEVVSRELQQTATGYGQLLLQEKRNIQLAVFALAKEAERLENAEPSTSRRVYYASDYDTPGQAPPDYKPSEHYVRRTPDGQLIPMPVSREQLVVAMAPGVSPERHAADIHRFNNILPFFRDITAQVGIAAFRVYIGLASGVQFSYPGHGGYPPGFDPRKRPWFERALRLDGVAWTVPVMDAVTGQLVLTVSKPFYYPDGRLAGVAAIDVLVRDILRSHTLASQWSMDLRSFLTVMEVNPDTKQTGLLILAGGDEPRGSRAWVYQWLNTGYGEPGRTMMSDLGRGLSGRTIMPYEGVESLWAYVPLEDDTQFIVVVPTSVISSISEKAGDRVIEATFRQRITLAVVALLVFLAVAVAAYRGSRAVTRPLIAVVEGWRRVGDGDFSVRLKARFNDERDLVVEAFNEITPRMEDHLYMTRALELAREVQQNLLPAGPPEFPGLDIAGSSMYCERTGGDYYDYLDFSEDGFSRRLVVVGDVSGHGISSAFVMATARALLRLRSSMPGDLSSIIRDVNRHLARDTYHTGQFMTLFCTEFHEQNRKISWVRAGHDPALVYSRIRDEFTELKGSGLALGIVPDFAYRAYDYALTSGDVILIGTDGIWETHNPDGGMFGRERLKAVVRENAGRPSSDIIAAVRRALADFRGDLQNEDDVTMVVVKVDA